ncbi:hypothetical protein OsI_36836 [Oryza sativa Indica Group]|uniref:Uncharacterized protein n=1 Tax=Oryza sativa subsp. indica TaxID=39946 RepID=B8BLK3_ORYSI|nr:hypothetical protein OsI_36836 [Oryza sativa Indica Group]
MAALIMGRREYARSSLPHRLSACLLLPPWSLTVVVTAIAAPWRHEERGGRQVAQPQLRTMVSLEWFPSTPAIRGRGSSSTREAHPAQHQEVRAPMDVVVKKLEREMDFMPSETHPQHSGGHREEVEKEDGAKFTGTEYANEGKDGDWLDQAKGEKWASSMALSQILVGHQIPFSRPDSDDEEEEDDKVEEEEEYEGEETQGEVPAARGGVSAVETVAATLQRTEGLRRRWPWGCRLAGSPACATSRTSPLTASWGSSASPLWRLASTVLLPMD